MAEAGLYPARLRRRGNLVMSATGRDGDEGGLFGPSGELESGPAAILAIARHLSIVATGKGGELKPQAAIQLALRSGDQRYELLENLLHEVCPNGADEKLWLVWLQGGPAPFATKVSKTGPGEERPAQTLRRSSDRVRSAQKKVDKKRSELKQKKGELDEAERELAYVERYDNAALHWVQ